MTDSPSSPRPPQQHGVLVLDKPKGPTSARCLEVIKRRLGQKKIGHAGTLDPMATGVLVVCLGEATKLAGYLTEGFKVYTGHLRLGQTTDTFDAEGRVTAEAPWEHVSPEAARDAVRAWMEKTTQEIPPYSAVKVDGQRLYKLAREGRDVPEVIKPVRVFDAETLHVELPLIHFRVKVSPGAYVRSLVHSLGTRLGCGAHLTELTRETSHPFGLSEAVSLDDLVDNPDRLAERLIPLEKALPHWPRLALSEAQARAVRDGKRLPLEDLPGPETRAVLVTPDGLPVALAEPQDLDGARRWAILRGLNPA
ncbi:tRNA pseudouridine synthase B [Fundidesulfovibrio magnetotacticus]|uniref:tRNA pseudouridine synthase B n=1 Tax=Fundidesulfovibrio magnetotacticus TaxID=2730080 RepID=A0A6V8LJ03_9BACT|nr:tRNA pseudouridine(55) synthase TruB [Fundidesulfovibrio magnetotacticus]GFK92722.1 tRNA pseudouridine synthase B [Fundidesulfovibrio magnetotacticus]